jgi:hypothetical protein
VFVIEVTEQSGLVPDERTREGNGDQKAGANQ